MRRFAQSATAAKYRETGSLVAFRELAAGEIHRLTAGDASLPSGWESVYESELVPFASYPCEWSPSQLYAAADLTLCLARDALAEGYGLKDSVPSNVLFRGARAVFVDLLSFEPRDPEDAIWRPNAQFATGFLIPLLLYRHTRLSPRMVFSGGRDGTSLREARSVLPLSARIRSPGRSLLTLPLLLEGLADRLGERLYAPRPTPPRATKSILEKHFAGLERTLARLRPSIRRSQWSSYSETTHSQEYHRVKQRLVTEILDRHRPGLVLDVGSNTGTYARMAARAGASVVAIDADVESIERCVESATTQNLDIQSLVVDIANPTPASGWGNFEQRSFLARSRHRFDLVMALALVHHLIVGLRIPLSEVMHLLSSLTRKWLVIEFVGETDAMSRRLARGRDAVGLTRAAFEQAVLAHFTIESSVDIADSDRVLYLLRLHSRGV